MHFCKICTSVTYINTSTLSLTQEQLALSTRLNVKTVKNTQKKTSWLLQFAFRHSTSQMESKLLTKTEKRSKTHLYSSAGSDIFLNQSLISPRRKILNTPQGVRGDLKTWGVSAGECAQTFVFLQKGNYIYRVMAERWRVETKKGERKRKAWWTTPRVFPLGRDDDSLKNSRRGDLWSLSKLTQVSFYPLSQSCHWESDSHYRNTPD